MCCLTFRTPLQDHSIPISKSFLMLSFLHRVHPFFSYSVSSFLQNLIFSYQDFPNNGVKRSPSLSEHAFSRDFYLVNINIFVLIFLNNVYLAIKHICRIVIILSVIVQKTLNYLFFWKKPMECSRRKKNKKSMILSKSCFQILRHH